MHSFSNPLYMQHRSWEGHVSNLNPNFSNTFQMQLFTNLVSTFNFRNTFLMHLLHKFSFHDTSFLHKISTIPRVVNYLGACNHNNRLTESQHNIECWVPVRSRVMVPGPVMGPGPVSGFSLPHPTRVPLLPARSTTGLTGRVPCPCRGIHRSPPPSTSGTLPPLSLPCRRGP